MSTYEIIPSDTLFFRGGEPMGMGESHFQSSVFPPSPETIIGFIRTAVIAHHAWADFEGYKMGIYKAEQWYGEIGYKTLPGTFRFSGPFLKKDDLILFPAPSNLFAYTKKDNARPRYAVARPRRFIELVCDSGPRSIMWIDSDGRVESSDWKPVKDYITMGGMEKYLKGAIDALDLHKDFVRVNDLFVGEERVGIAIDKARGSAREGHLYSTAHTRLSPDATLIFTLAGASSFPDTGITTLGGENRLIRYEKIADVNLPSFQGDVEFLVTITPIKIEKVSQGIPLTPFLTEGLDVLLPGGVKTKLVAYSVGRPLLFGGWDMAEKKSKEMVQYVPPGSVFCFEKCSVRGQDDKFLLGGRNVR